MATSASRIVTATLFVGTMLAYPACRTIEPEEAVVADASVLAVPAKPEPRGVSLPRFAGYLLLPDQSAKVPMTLDFAASRAVLRVTLGRFDGTEYGAAHFGDVTRDAATKTWRFAAGPDGVSLELTEGMNGTMTGRVGLGLGLPLAEVQLTRIEEGSTAAPIGFPSVPVAAMVSGSFDGTCDGKKTEIRLSTSKWRSSKELQTLAGYQVQGFLAQPDEVLCGASDLCIKEGFSGGSYDLVSGKLTLRNGPLERECTLKGDALTCDTCNLKRVAEAHPAPARLKVAAPMPPSVTEGAVRTTATLRDGQYYGYLIHETRGARQLVALNVETATTAAVMSLYLGEGDSSEFTAHRLSPTAHEATTTLATPAPLLLDGEGEAFAIITESSATTVKGVWYSKSFGRVGPFELQRDLVPALEPRLSLVGRLSGAFQSDAWTFEIATSANVSEDASDFFPLKIYGWAQENLLTSRRRTIESGVYDPYTDTIALRLDDGRVAFGKPTAGGLALSWPQRPRVGSAVEALLPRDFKRVELKGDRSAVLVH